MPWMQFAHPDQAKVRKVGSAVLVPRSQVGKARRILAQVEYACEHALLNQGEHVRTRESGVGNSFHRAGRTLFFEKGLAAR